MSITVSYNDQNEVVKIEETFVIIRISGRKQMKKVQNIIPRSGDTLATQTEVFQDTVVKNA